MVKHLPTVWETRVRSLGREDTMEKEMATHSSVLAWKIPWTEEPGGRQSMGLQRVGHDWATLPHLHLTSDIILDHFQNVLSCHLLLSYSHPLVTTLLTSISTIGGLRLPRARWHWRGSPSGLRPRKDGSCGTALWPREPPVQAWGAKPSGDLGPICRGKDWPRGDVLGRAWHSLG